MEEKVRRLLHRLQEIEQLLGQPEALADQKAYRQLTQEHSQLQSVREVWDDLQRVHKQIEDSRVLLSNEQDEELLNLVKEELVSLQVQEEALTKQLKNLLVPPDPRDDRSIMLEIRAGTGGEEAALFVADCARMYRNYADQKGWKAELISASPAELGGYREYIVSFSGKGVFRFMQYEAGTHRVQRVPKTETQGRIHTSAVTVAILLEPDEHEKVQIDEKDLKIDTYRSSGAGGQHVNTTDSAVRITHIPTGTVVACQDERSQHKNREKAMRVLSARIVEEMRRKSEQEMSALRSTQIGSGDRSERIRTYNFPQNRVTDHRIDLTLYKLDRIMEGDLDELTQALVAYFYAEKMKT
jgi:peptide chain release factor 1